jgi:hypothetical protein
METVFKMRILVNASHFAMNNTEKYRNIIDYLFMSVLAILFVLTEDIVTLLVTMDGIRIGNRIY